MKYFIMCFVLCLFECDNRSHTDIANINEKHIAGKGEYVGLLPDGRKIVRYQIQRKRERDHWIYVVPHTVTISDNHSNQTGKYTYNSVEVIIDGVKFASVEKEE